MKRVLLTGASGFIGRHVALALVHRGYEVHAVSSRGRASAPGGVIWHRANLLEAGSHPALVSEVRPTHLVHLAWSVEPGAFWTSSGNLRWLGASLDLLRAFVAAGGRRVVVAGSCAEYASGEADLSETDTPIAPATLYGVAKDALHRVADRYLRQERVELAWGRIFYVYGPHEPAGRLVPSVVAALLRGEAPSVAYGASLRDYLHVADVGSAFAAILDSPVCGPVNIGSGEAVAVRRLAELLAVECGRPDLVTDRSVADRADDPPRVCADARTLRSAVGWVPEMSLAEGLRQTAAWWQTRLREGVRAGH